MDNLIKRIFIVIFGLIIVMVMFLLPFIINFIYSIDLHIDFFKHSYEKNQLLIFYSNFMSIIVTLFLGAISVYQTIQNNKKSKEIDRLNTEVMNHYIDMKINKYEIVNIPQFSVHFSRMGGTYADLGIEIQNVSKIIASEISPLKFEILYDGISTDCVNGRQTKKVLDSKESLVFYYKNKGIKNDKASFLLRFRCKNERGNLYLFEAKKEVDISNNLDTSEWKVNLIK